LILSGSFVGLSLENDVKVELFFVDSRKVVVEIPYPLRSGNLLTCLKTELDQSFIINPW